MYNRCRTSKAAKLHRICSATIFPGTVLFCVVIPVVQVIILIPSEVDTFRFPIAAVCFAGILLIAGILLLKYSLQYYCFESRKYVASERGLTIVSIFRKTQTIPWSDVFEIGIYAFDATANLERYTNVYCIFLKPKPEGTERKLLGSNVFAVKNMDWLVVIDYSQESKMVLEKFSTIKIEDNRSSQLSRCINRTGDGLREP